MKGYINERRPIMKNIKKLGLIASILVLALALLASCGGGSSTSDSGSEGGDADKTIKVAASPTPHAEILNAVAGTLEKEGWTLEVEEFDDYVQPNVATTDGDVDANFFQHVPYLDEYNAQNGTKLVSVAAIHYEPMGVYAGTKKSFDELADGDKIGIPNDATNGARALLLLQDNGVIKLKDGAGVTATEQDIAENPKNIKIVPLEAATIPASLPDLALGIINGNYAIGAGLKIADALATEDAKGDAAQTYANIIAVQNGNENSEKTTVLLDALKTDAVKKYIEDTYAGAVVAIF